MLRRIRAFKPQLGAVKLTTRRAFDKAVAYGETWNKFRKDHPLTYCARCGRPAEARHHDIPVTKGGKHLASNVTELCDDCHAKKHRHLQPFKRQRRRRR